MHRIRHFFTRCGPLALAVIALAGCDRDLPTSSVNVAELAAAPGNGVGASSANGGGHYDLVGTIVQFAFSAVQHGNGNVSGAFHHKASYEFGGEMVTADWSARVTCIAIDAALGRAWIGGVITANRSTDPDYQAEVYQPGHDIWFRVRDTGPGSPDADRTTFVGFESASIPTSADYCALRPWRDNNTWAVTGNVSINP